MRARRLLVPLLVLLVAGGAGGYGWYAWWRPVSGDPARIAADYLDAWRRGDHAAMRALVAQPPADFDERHRRLARDLRVESITLTAGAPVRRGQSDAEVPVQGVRQITGVGPWPFTTTLRLGVREREWKVLWTPQTMHTALEDGGSLRLAEIKVPASELVTRSGVKMPQDNAAEPYLSELNERLNRTTSGWAVERVTPAGEVRRLIVYQPPPERKVRTTISRPIQAAAARALDGVAEPAAIVAVRASTGEVLAVADRLGGTRRAFEEVYAPGGAFTVVTAAALLADGLTQDSQVPCPKEYTPPEQRQAISTAGTPPTGTVSLARALSLRCTTTFAQQAVERLTAEQLAAQAEALGFGQALGTGVGGTCGQPPKKDAGKGALASDAIGHNTVTATPLCMALVAAAVDSGTWRPPRLVTERAARALDRVRPNEVKIPDGVLAGLRGMMRAEAAQAPSRGTRALPEGSAGHAATTEGGADGKPDAWYLGYRQDVAFAVFVKDGGAPGRAALPIASRFLRAL
ncbi:hypothetical protein HNP84_006300 [Thermocatellispora tengchongensis]|uniref:Cell division protein FtsI n=1 Tax=Thermocatellispora tengchongensis TaxID=1073253 RepID=A0A840PF38_9ACTN|nr:penicillin-binding transpeptidase domain-containing protein [Thermocatellispora tengchongensis]MBB5136553.1 hypothetical protein [Thermocatellispora tengchongensis]